LKGTNQLKEAVATRQDTSLTIHETRRAHALAD
jgi:hypothetical protein